ASGGTVNVRGATSATETRRRTATEPQRHSVQHWFLCCSVLRGQRSLCLCGVLRGFPRLAPLALRNRRIGPPRQVNQHADRQRREDDRDELRRRKHAHGAAIVATEDLDDVARNR